MKRVRLLFVLACVFVFNAWAVYATETATETPMNEIEVLEAKICQGIADKQPQGAGDVASGGVRRLYCFSKIASTMESEVTHVWYKGENEVARIDLRIGASGGWRTFSSKQIPPNSKDNWKVDILTADNTVLKTLLFVIND